MTIVTKNKIRATPAVAIEIPVKPSNPAAKEMTRNSNANLSILFAFRDTFHT